MDGCMICAHPCERTPGGRGRGGSSGKERHPVSSFVHKDANLWATVKLSGRWPFAYPAFVSFCFPQCSPHQAWAFQLDPKRHPPLISTYITVCPIDRKHDVSYPKCVSRYHRYHCTVSIARHGMTLILRFLLTGGFYFLFKLCTYLCDLKRDHLGYVSHSVTIPSQQKPSLERLRRPLTVSQTRHCPPALGMRPRHVQC